jgi:nitroreductase
MIGRDPWAVSADDYPSTAPAAEQLRHLLRWAILAPSIHNTQPWLFRLQEDAVELFADTRRTLRVVDPERRQLFMSCGAALFNLRIAIRRFGRADLVDYGADPARSSFIARVRLGPAIPSAEADLRLFDAIPQRRTNRRPFAVRSIGQELGDDLAREAARQGAWLTRLAPGARAEIAALVAEADRRQFADDAFRSELARWLVPPGSGRADGIPFYRTGRGSRTPHAVTLLVRSFDIGGDVAARGEQLDSGSPFLALLGTDHDEAADWVAAGEAMQAVLLRAASLGISASFLNQGLEIPELRGRIGRLAERDGWPQLLLRMGYGPPIPATPRRPLDQVLLP